MGADRFFLDTFYALALLNSNDAFHAEARSLFSRFRSAAEVWVTEAVLTEIANSLSSRNRKAAAQFIDQCFMADNVRVVSVDPALFRSALELYERYEDKHWGLTDCISFVVMRQNSLADALTGDHHFEQAGFRILFRPTS